MDAHAELLRQIGIARGRPLQEITAGQGGLVRLVLAGCVDAHARVAWIEFCNPSFAGLREGYTLRVAAAGNALVEYALDVRWGGLEIDHLGWYGDHVVVVGWLPQLAVVAVPVPNADDDDGVCFELTRPHAIADGRLVFGGRDDAGALEALSLPDLRPLLPVPLPAPWMRASKKMTIEGGDAVIEVAGGGAPVRVRLAPIECGLGDDAALTAAVARALELPESPDLAIVIDAALAPFLYSSAELQPRAYTMERSKDWLDWLPVYWFEHLRDHDDPARAASFLARLDDLAARVGPEPGWDGDVARLAARHVCRRAAMFAQVCRTGRLPEDWYDYSVGPHDDDRDDDPGFWFEACTPTSLREAWDAIMRCAPVSLSRRSS